MVGLGAHGDPLARVDQRQGVGMWGIVQEQMANLPHDGTNQTQVGMTVEAKANGACFTPFFYVQEIKEADLACASSVSVAVVRLRRRVPMNSWTFPEVKDVVSDLESVYLPGCSKKKNAMIIMSAVARRKCASGRKCSTTYAMWRITEIGMVLMQCAGGSLCFQAASILWM